MNAPKPIDFADWYENGRYNVQKEREHFSNPDIRAERIEWVRVDFELSPDTPEEIIKDILLDNGFTDYAELLFPEIK